MTTSIQTGTNLAGKLSEPDGQLELGVELLDVFDQFAGFGSVPVKGDTVKLGSTVSARQEKGRNIRTVQPWQAAKN